MEETTWKEYWDVYKLRTPQQWAKYDLYHGLVFEEVTILKKKRAAFRQTITKVKKPALFLPDAAVKYKEQKDEQKDATRSNKEC